MSVRRAPTSYIESKALKVINSITWYIVREGWENYLSTGLLPINSFAPVLVLVLVLVLMHLYINRI